MKTALFTLLLAAAPMCLFAQRILSPANNSWDEPNLSVETYQTRVVAGFSEINPSTGVLSPAFKVTDLSGVPGAAFFLDFSPDPVYLMDFTINTTNQTIVLTGMTAAISATTPYKMFVAECTFSGTLIQCSIEYLSSSSSSMIPHEVVFSPGANQVVVVGTKIDGFPMSSSYASLPKEGFILGLNANNFNMISFVRSTNTSVTGTTDNDMLENIIEVPGSGYFITGSANNSSNEQNLLTMGVSYSGGITHANIHDLTNYRMAGSSVVFVPASNRVYVLCNNSAMHTFQIAYFNPTTGVIGSQWWRHVITAFPVGGGVDVNGFRVQATQNAQILVSGYIVDNTLGYLGCLMTPFQMQINPNLNSVVTAKFFQSNNNSPLTGYFNEIGNSTYINTPDIAAYSQVSGKNYIVNQYTGTGYDLNIAGINSYSGCEKAVQTNPGVTTDVLVGTPIIGSLPMYGVTYWPVYWGRTLAQSTTCSFSSAIATVSSGTLSPNPAHDYITVENENGVKDVVIYDLKGNTVGAHSAVTQERGTGATRLNISMLPAGVYMILYTDNDGNTLRERFVKE